MAYATQAAKDKAVAAAEKQVATLTEQQRKAGERYKDITRQLRIATGEVEHRKTAVVVEADETEPPTE